MRNLNYLILLVFQIKLCFLLVGHTHEDIDQMFSCISRRLAKEDAHTLDNLENIMEDSYNPHIKVTTLSTVVDVKEWMGDVSNDVSGHIYQHQFKIVRNKEGKAEIFYKKWSLTEKWLPEGENGINVIDGVPTGDPKILPPRIDNINLDRIEQDLPKFRLKFDGETEKWWADFIETQRKGQRPNLLWKLPRLTPTQTATHDSSQVTKSAEEIEGLFNKEQREVEVRIIKDAVHMLEPRFSWPKKKTRKD